MKALLGAFNQEMAVVWAFSVIVKTDGSFAALVLITPELLPDSAGRVGGEEDHEHVEGGDQPRHQHHPLPRPRHHSQGCHPPPAAGWRPSAMFDVCNISDPHVSTFQAKNRMII